MSCGFWKSCFPHSIPEIKPANIFTLSGGSSRCKSAFRKCFGKKVSSNPNRFETPDHWQVKYSNYMLLKRLLFRLLCVLKGALLGCFPFLLSVVHSSPDNWSRISDSLTGVWQTSAAAVLLNREKRLMSSYLGLWVHSRHVIWIFSA